MFCFQTLNLTYVPNPNLAQSGIRPIASSCIYSMMECRILFSSVGTREHGKDFSNYLPGYNHCSLILKQPKLFKSCPKSNHSSDKSDYFKIAKKVIKYLTYFCKKICCQDLSNITQFGNTDYISGTKFEKRFFLQTDIAARCKTCGMQTHNILR